MDLWTQILDLASKLVVPDWSALVAIIPLGLAGLIALYLVWLARRYATAGPTMRGKARIPPRPPAGIHMPGPSFAPVFAAIGAFLLFFGLVVGGIALPLGLVALALALLYWGREALRDYEHLEPPATTLPVPVPREPPPGVHIPPPSFRPILASIATVTLLFGLIMAAEPRPAGDPRPPVILLAGLILVAWSLLGWLGDARREYVATEAADRTGHLEAGRAPRWPAFTFVAFGAIIVAAMLVEFGVVPPRPSPAGDVTGASPAPSGAPASASPAASPEPVPSGDVTITAEAIKFLETAVTAPAGRPFTIVFINRDEGILHNVFITDANAQPVEMGDTTPFPGVRTVVYNVAALAPGEYPYICIVHPTIMVGTLTAK